MPRLADIGTFLYYSEAKVSDDAKNMATKMKAIDVITEILKYKLSKEGVQYRLYILNGRTGSGKSTYFLQELYKRFCVGTRSKIICTEPQVVLTESNARDIMNYNSGWSLGVELGVKSSKMHINGDIESITFYTTQILNDELVRMMIKSNMDTIKKQLSRIKFIIIDEVHTLDIPMISTLKVLRDAVFKYGNLREFPLVIFSSATLDIKALSTYFKMDVKDPFSIGIVSGDPNFPVDEYYLSTGDTAKYNAIEKAKNNITTSFVILGQYFCQQLYPKMMKDSDKSRDTLIFVPGAVGIKSVGDTVAGSINDIPVYFIEKDSTIKSLMDWRGHNRGKKRLLIVGFASGYSEASDSILSTSEDTDEEALNNEMKLIVATTALETGKTLYRLKYVIDMGLQTTPVNVPLSYDTSKTMMYFRQIPENKNQMIQRKGRVGRVASGIAIHFYPKEVEEMLQPSSTPQTVDSYCLSEVMLRSLVSKKLWKPYDMANENDFLYPTSTDIIIVSMQDLIYAGYMTIHGVLSRLYHKSIDVNKQRIYAKYLYECLGYNLFDTALYVTVNIKEIPNKFDVKSFKPKNSMDLSKDFMNNDRPTSQMIEQIRRARGEVTIAQYNMKNSIYAYYKRRLF